ncbi:MAG: DsrE family protein [Planctomycetaceae bacterium]|nr:DsrE family protein [Planctomycetaceae bacterium]
MNRLLRLTCLVLAWVPGLTVAQEQSVRPGINDSFRDPNVTEFVGKFEVERREVFARRQAIVAACKIQPGQTVADIGAGTGLFTRLFAEAVSKQGRVIAIDIAQKFLDHVTLKAREAGLTNIDTLLSKPDSTELPPESVDVAFICDTYHHFEFPLKTMASVKQALKPGGRVIVVDFHRVEGQSSDWVLSHVRAGQGVFEQEINTAGLRSVGELDLGLKENYALVFEKPRLEFPTIAKFGGVVSRTTAAEMPQAGAKAILDIVTDSKPQEVNKGLERVARLLNLYGTANLRPADVKITVILHGDATKVALKNADYGRRFATATNPNEPLLTALRTAGVEILVCGQALNYKGIADREVAEGISIAASALTAVINKQTAGYAYVPIH